MNLNEFANEILKREDAEIAKAFTMVVASLLLSKGIQPIINKSLVEYDENDDLNKYILRKEYNVTFDIDTSAHDYQIRKEEREKTIDDCINAINDFCGGLPNNNLIDALEHLKENK